MMKHLTGITTHDFAGLRRIAGLSNRSRIPVRTDEEIELIHEPAGASMHGRKAAWQTGISGNLQCLERFAGSGQGCGRGSYSLAGILT